MKTDYQLHTLNEGDFEEVVIKLCSRLLGAGITPFSKGKDGGRDARFNGKANSYPSENKSLEGKFVIQAKHTTNPVASCSDSSFDKLLDKEEKKVKRLVVENKCDYYLVFTNRKMSGIKDEVLMNKLSGWGPKEVDIFGIERIGVLLDMWADLHPSMPLNLLPNPLEFTPDDLREVVIGFYETINSDDNPFDSSADFHYLKKPKGKNKLNKLTDAYYQMIEEKSVPFFKQIKEFLENPRNTDLSEMYHDTADELKQKIITFRDKFGTFDEVLTHLYDGFVNSDERLRKRKRYISIFLHYMYFDCDIGQNVNTEETS